MTRLITQRELRNDSDTILREVQAGETIIVSRSGVPVAEFRPVQARKFVCRALIKEAAVRAPRIDFTRFHHDLDVILDPAVDA